MNVETRHDKKNETGIYRSAVENLCSSKNKTTQEEESLQTKT